MAKLTLKQAHKYCKAIWKWLSLYSNPHGSAIGNKRNAIRELKIGIELRNNCPYCEYVFQKRRNCEICPIEKKYPTKSKNLACHMIGYMEYMMIPSKAAAKEFYDKIKVLK